MPRLLCLLVPLLAFVAPTSSQDKQQPKKDPPPKLLYAVPLVAKPGEKQKLSLRGKNLAGVKEVRATGDGVKVKVLGAKAVAVPNNYPAERVGDSEVEIEIELPKNAKPGEVKLTAVGATGESDAYELPVRDNPSAVGEKEDNGGFDAAQKIATPCAVEGAIKGERDVDTFRLDGTKGDKLVIEVQAARLGSPLDGFLTLYDADKNAVASSDDAGGSADPALTVTLPKDGTYFLVLIDAHDFGGTNFGYRLVVRKGK